MPKPKIGIQLLSLRQPLKKALHTAARLGAAGVEIDVRNQLVPGELSHTGLRQFHKLLEELHLEVCAVSFYTRDGYDVQDRLERRVDATKQAVRFAHDLRCHVLINHVAWSFSSADDETGQRLLAVLTDLGRFALRYGVVIAARMGGLSPENLAGLIRHIPEEHLGANLDPLELISRGYRPADAIGLLGPYVRHVHAADGVKDTSAGGGSEVQLGRGSADFVDLAGRLEEYDYRGYFTVQRQNADAPENQVGQAVRYLQNL